MTLISLIDFQICLSTEAPSDDQSKDAQDDQKDDQWLLLYTSQNTDNETSYLPVLSSPEKTVTPHDLLHGRKTPKADGYVLVSAGILNINFTWVSYRYLKR